MYSWVEDEKCSSFPHKALSRLICRWGTRRVQSRPHQGGGAALGPPMGPCVPFTQIEERRSKGGRGDPAGGRWLRRRRQQQRLALGAAVAGGSGGARRRDNGATETGPEGSLCLTTAWSKLGLDPLTLRGGGTLEGWLLLTKKTPVLFSPIAVLYRESTSFSPGRNAPPSKKCTGQRIQSATLFEVAH